MKMPRHYASEINALATRQEKVSAIQAVPEHFQEMVKTYLNIEREFKKQARAKKG